MGQHPKTPPRLTRVYPRYPVYFLTLCTHRRRAILADSRVHEEFIGFCLDAFKRRNIAVGRFVIMPDHVHLFVRPPEDQRLGPWVGLLKQRLTQRLSRIGHESPIWQRGFFDHVLRSSESYTEKWAYVYQNPVRKGLVRTPEAWPYAGEIVPISGP